MKFSLYFLAYEDKNDIPKNANEKTAWTFSRKATLELTQWVLNYIIGVGRRISNFCGRRATSSALHIFVGWKESVFYRGWGTGGRRTQGLDVTVTWYCNAMWPADVPSGFEGVALQWACCHLFLLPNHGRPASAATVLGGLLQLDRKLELVRKFSSWLSFCPASADFWWQHCSSFLIVWGLLLSF